MKHLALTAVLIMAAQTVVAEEHKLGDAQIRQALSGHTLKGDGDNGGWTQEFDPAGRTTYSQGNSNSPGLWQVKGDQYCSSWPPNPNLSCYDVTVDGAVITFISKTGERTKASIVK